MSTALDEIKGASRLIGQLAEGEDPSAATAQDALTALNSMLDSWSIERLSVFGTQDQVFTWPAAQATRTLGPGVANNFIGLRPVQLLPSSFFRDTGSGVSYDIELINEARYNGIALKTATSTYPQVMFVETLADNIALSVYPVPTKALEFHFISIIPLTQAANLVDELIIPPGYRRAFKFNLALEIASEFGVEARPTVKRIAAVSKRALKRINSPDDMLSLPAGLGGGVSRYNIYSGTS